MSTAPTHAALAPRHCMIVHAYYPLDVRVEREAHILAAAGHQVEVICLRGDSEKRVEVVDGVRVHRMPLARHRGVAVGLQLVEYLAFLALAFAQVTVLHQQRPFGVVQVHNLPDFLIFAGTIPRLTGAKLVLDLHDLMPEFYASKFGSGRASVLTRVVALQERVATGFADHVITVTELWRQKLIRRGVSPDRVDVVMNVPDAAIFGPHVRQDRGPHDMMLAIYHGTLTHRYGIDVAIKAIARIRDVAPVRLLIYGAGEYLPELNALTESLGMQERVAFHAPVSRPELARVIGSVDVGIVPNRSDVFTDDILPTKLMEYAAVGIPAITSRTPGVEQYFDDQMVRYVRAGSVDDMADALVALYRSADERARLAAGIGRFLEKQSYDQQVETYLRVVETLHSRT